ncbi:Hypothetical protein PHPALM_8173, partial [Phytophthora palmivora]
MSLHTVNPLEDADAELRAMARYYLAEDTENPPPNQSIPVIAPKATDKLKKLKRNERDRQRSFAKRESMKQMRQQVKELQERKQAMARYYLAEDTENPPPNQSIPVIAPKATDKLKKLKRNERDRQRSFAKR